MSAPVLVLNQNWQAIDAVHWKKALRLISNNKAVVLKWSGRYIQTFTHRIAVPLAIRLVTLVRRIYKARVPFTRGNLFLRDTFTCQYCGTSFAHDKSHLSIDHIIPQSRGGLTTWENCITSCKKCNGFKADRTPNEASMKLLKKAYQPTIAEFLELRIKLLGLDSIMDEIFEGVKTGEIVY